MEQIASWEEPPEDVREADSSPNKYVDLVRELRENKDQWALLEPRRNVAAAKSLASNIRHGKLHSFLPAGSFEVKMQDVKVWVRYVGEPEGYVPPKPRKKPNQAIVRAWARANGRYVPARGQLSAELIEDWEDAMRGR